MTTLTLAMKFDAVHSTTTTRSKQVPIVCLAILVRSGGGFLKVSVEAEAPAPPL